ncbi:hypothetical protein AB0G15_14510 [Streptosporangium sp. NPDC023825]|uniref:hypothetical protein n=1 Tax=Streptosporangium sp. NPDC023825 TaxID=3154909 RepID=UPI00343CC9BF
MEQPVRQLRGFRRVSLSPGLRFPADLFSRSVPDGFSDDRRAAIPSRVLGTSSAVARPTLRCFGSTGVRCSAS